MDPHRLWQCFGSSVVGANHLNRNVPNQDAIHWRPVSGRDENVVLAVADGHGTGGHLRGARGANFAVLEASEVFYAFLLENGHNQDRNLFEHALTHRLPQEIALRWSRAVANDLQNDPLNLVEDARVNDLNDSALLASQYAYGTTLAVVAASRHFLMCLQLGDGDLLGVTANGICKPLLPEVPPTVDSTPDSLALPDATKRFRRVVLPLSAHSPVLVLVASDGYRNAFVNRTDFLQVGTDYLVHLRENGMLDVSQALDSWLNDTSREGSGDDVSVGMMYRLKDYYAHKGHR